MSGTESPSQASDSSRPAWIHAGYLQAAAAVTVATGVSRLMFPFFDPASLMMAYLLAVVIIAARHGHGPSVFASVASVAAFDFFFVPPYFTFAVADTQYLLEFAVMLVVALVISGLTVRVRRQAEAAQQREQQTAALYAMSRDLAQAVRGGDLVAIAVRHIREIFGAELAVYLADIEGRLQLGRGNDGASLEEEDLVLSRWVFSHRQPAGLGTKHSSAARAMYLPLVGSQGSLGVVIVRPHHRDALTTPEQRRQLETFLNQMALAIERAQLAEEAQEAHVRIETERLRSSLLSSVSHDLRTPLSTITGAVSTILESGPRLDDQTRKELLESAHEEAERLNRLVQNLLEMTRLESGALDLRKEWHSIEEVIGAALNRLGKRLAGRPIHTRVFPDLPLVAMDDVLIEQVLLNLLDNTLKYTPPGSPISVTATATDQDLYVEVADRGPGLAAGEETRIFEKFYRGAGQTTRGTGLGLAICRAVVRAHGGRISAQNLPEGGAAFFFSLPITEAPPASVPADA